MVGFPLTIPLDLIHQIFRNLIIIISPLSHSPKVLRCRLCRWLIHRKDFYHRNADMFFYRLWRSVPRLLGSMPYCNRVGLYLYRKFRTERSAVCPIVLRWIEPCAGNWCPGGLHDLHTLPGYQRYSLFFYPALVYSGISELHLIGKDNYTLYVSRKSP